MAVTINQRPGGINIVEGKSAEVKYLATGSAALDELLAAIADPEQLPETLLSWPRREVNLATLQDADDLWEITARYAAEHNPDLLSPRMLPVGTMEYNFQIGGGSRRIYQSLQTTQSKSVFADVPDHKGAINVTDDGVDGVEVPGEGGMRFGITKAFPSGTVSQSWIRTVAGLYLKTNSGIFGSFPGGELLFLGVSGSVRADGAEEITFHLSASTQETIAVPVIGDMTVPPHHYLWVQYASVEDTVARKTVRRPQSAYVEKVFPGGDYAGLGIL